MNRHGRLQRGARGVSDNQEEETQMTRKTKTETAPSVATVQPDAKRPAYQGDVQFRRVDMVPAGVSEVPRERGLLIVTHSETGHHHAIADAGPSLWTVPGDAMTSYLRIPAGVPSVDVVHHRPWDTHQTLRLLADESQGETVYEIRRQREWTPEGWRRVED